MWTGEHSGGALDHLRVPPIDRSRAERTANGDPRLRYIFDAVRQAPHPPQPARLNLNHDGFGDEGGRCLGAALKGLPEPLRLCSIGVASCNLTASGIAEIAAGVRGRSFAEPGLKVLNVSGNARLGDEGVMELLPLLVPTLEELYIANVGLGDVGMDALATKLPRAPALGILSCNANPNIVGFGWKALGATLSKLLVLKSLQAEGCSGMGDSGAGVLVAGILGCPVLETVNLHACKIGDEGACAVAKVLRERKQTQVLLIYTTGNEYGGVGKAALDAADATSKAKRARDVHESVEGTVALHGQMVDEETHKKDRLRQCGVRSYCDEMEQQPEKQEQVAQHQGIL